MAQYKHLPIYKTTYNLLELIVRKTKEFPKNFKYSFHNCYRKIKSKTNLFELRPTVNSYFGMLRHTNSYKERLKLAKKLGIVGAWFNAKLTKMVIRKRKKLCIYK